MGVPLCGGKPERKGDLDGERMLVVRAKEVQKPRRIRYLYCAPYAGYIFNEVISLTRDQGYRYRDIRIVCCNEDITNRMRSTQ